MPSGEGFIFRKVILSVRKNISGKNQIQVIQIQKEMDSEMLSER